MGNIDHNVRRSTVCLDTLINSPHYYPGHLVDQGTSEQNPGYCCLTSKRTLLQQQGHSLRSSIHFHQSLAEHKADKEKVNMTSTPTHIIITIGFNSLYYCILYFLYE